MPPPMNDPMAQAAPVAPAGPMSTDPAALIQQLVAMASDDQTQLEMQQQMQMQQLADQQKQAMIQALQGLIQGLGGGAHVPGGPEAAAAPIDEYQGIAPGLPMEALAQADMMGGGGPAGPMPIVQPDEIPPQFG